MNTYIRNKLKCPKGPKNWLSLFYNLILVIAGLYFCSAYLINNAFGKYKLSPIVAVLMIIWATTLLIRSIRNLIKFHGRSLAVPGQCFLWLGALLVQVWSIVSFSGDNFIAAFGALAAAISGIIGIVNLTSYSMVSQSHI
jgi:hypothetical protein